MLKGTREVLKGSGAGYECKKDGHESFYYKINTFKGEANGSNKAIRVNA
jgi:hypothetical protein